MEMEILELKLEVSRLQSLLANNYVPVSESDVELRPAGGFKPRHEVAKDIRLAIARKAREIRDERS